MKLNTSRLGRYVKQVYFLSLCSALQNNKVWYLQSLPVVIQSLVRQKLRKTGWEKALVSLLENWWHCCVAQCYLLLLRQWVWSSVPCGDSPSVSTVMGSMSWFFCVCHLCHCSYQSSSCCKICFVQCKSFVSGATQQWEYESCLQSFFCPWPKPR